MAWYTSLYDLMTLRLYGGAHLAWSEMYMVMAGLAIVWYVLRRVRRRQAARTYAVLVTGASRGLGLAFARRFARLGDQVVITARDDKELQDAKATFPPYSGGKVYAKACDISSEQSVLELCRFIRGTVKTVDIWVNNAAVMEQPPTLFVDADVAQDMQRILNTNVLGTMIACRNHHALTPSCRVLLPPTHDDQGGADDYDATRRRRSDLHRRRRWRFRCRDAQARGVRRIESCCGAAGGYTLR
eukprot:TRINITY_DN857_c0_g1_i3.p1 TRINITY_DN857_c0_g1~~TRINITY_DN857_c0_g1_i3.p1  ORF type:complete len:243 (+),score=42.50 TRINITY_DN857_c0_g1_i3:79-807(+)